jgi:hypothetical protein
MSDITNSQPEANIPQDSPAHSAGSESKTSSRKAAANRANAQKSTGPSTEQGLERVARNLPAPSAARLLGLAEARILRQEPGAAEMLYRKLIEPYEPAPALLALHFQDLARLQLELQALERIRDAQIEHRAQQIAIKVRRLYREMDRELGVAPKDVFEKGLYSLEDSPAKFNMQFDALTVLKAQLQRRDFQAIGPALSQLYSNALNPGYERAQLICTDCQRLMDPESEPFSDGELKLLLRLVDREIEDAMEGYDLELDERTKTAEARLAELAPTREDRWMNEQADRLRRAIDRKQWVITGMIQAFGLAKKEVPDEADSAKKGTPLPPSDPKPTSHVESIDSENSDPRQSQ